jgi:hypothetical protein
MKTAVEWYNSKVIELMTQREQGNIDVLEFRNQLDLLLEQAKEMEKEKIIKHSLELAKILISNPYETSGKMPTELIDSYINKIFKSE